MKQGVLNLILLASSGELGASAIKNRWTTLCKIGSSFVGTKVEFVSFTEAIFHDISSIKTGILAFYKAKAAAAFLIINLNVKDHNYNFIFSIL